MIGAASLINAGAITNSVTIYGTDIDAANTGTIGGFLSLNGADSYDVDTAFSTTDVFLDPTNSGTPLDTNTDGFPDSEQTTTVTKTTSIGGDVTITNSGKGASSPELGPRRWATFRSRTAPW